MGRDVSAMSIDALPTAAAQACAERVVEIVPVLMDALRRAMRLNVDGEMSIPQFRCANHVARHPGCSVGDVAAFLGVTMPTASAMVDRLVRAGALDARHDDADRRRSRLELTAAGQARLARMRDCAQDDVALALAGCDAAELETVDAALSILRRAVQGR
jgi:DNA-binding MarR family transcriptional regulator